MLKYKLGTHELFFTSDPHFGHKNIIKYCDRPFADVDEMNEAIIANWNAKVPTTGIVFVVGDFCMNCSVKSIVDIRKRLNGRIILIRGNHDDFIIDVNKREQLFEAVYDRLDIRVMTNHEDATDYIDVELHHFPSLVWNNSHKGAWQAFGHCHSKRRIPHQSVFQHDVGMDGNNFTPLSFQEFGQIISARRLEGWEE